MTNTSKVTLIKEYKQIDNCIDWLGNIACDQLLGFSAQSKKHLSQKDINMIKKQGCKLDIINGQYAWDFKQSVHGFLNSVSPLKHINNHFSNQILVIVSKLQKMFNSMKPKLSDFAMNSKGQFANPIDCKFKNGSYQLITIEIQNMLNIRNQLANYFLISFGVTINNAMHVIV